MKKRLRPGLTAAAEWRREHRHESVDQQQKTLNAKLWDQYYGCPTNSRRLWQFYRAVCEILRKWLSRQTRGKAMTWARYSAFLRHHPLLRPWITHPWQCAGSRV